MIGGIKERSVSNKKPPTAPSAGRPTGFPRAEHRSKKSSAFLQNRQQQEALERDGGGAPRDPLASSIPAGLPATLSRPPPNPSQQPTAQNEASMKTEISTQNDERIQSMSEEQIESDRQDIMDRFGPGFLDLIRRAKEAQQTASSSSEVKVTSEWVLTCSERVDFGMLTILPACSIASDEQPRDSEASSRGAELHPVAPTNPVIGSLRGGMCPSA